jgi:anti-sigma-K factor RskA
MARGKYNIEEIKLLIPDYILGKLTPAESEMVRNTIDNSAELKDLYIKMSEGLGFTSSIKLKEPPPQYWSTLLPRIHERIEMEEAKGFSFDKVARYWKVLVPAAAVILIAIFYFTILNKSTDTEITKINTEEKVKDDVKKELPKDIVKERPMKISRS